jgi:hypothetical protein
MKFIGSALILDFLLPLQRSPRGAKTAYPRMPRDCQSRPFPESDIRRAPDGVSDSRWPMEHNQLHKATCVRRRYMSTRLDNGRR